MLLIAKEKLANWRDCSLVQFSFPITWKLAKNSRKLFQEHINMERQKNTSFSWWIFDHICAVIRSFTCKMKITNNHNLENTTTHSKISSKIHQRKTCIHLPLHIDVLQEWLLAVKQRCYKNNYFREILKIRNSKVKRSSIGSLGLVG